jgi:hypothetical protein
MLFQTDNRRLGHERPLPLSREAGSQLNAPDRTRTYDLRLRRPLLYPAELLALMTEYQSGRPDSNWRPLAPKASALPG